MKLLVVFAGTMCSCHGWVSAAASLEPQSQLAAGPELRSERHPNEMQSAQALAFTHGLPCFKSLPTSAAHAGEKSTPEVIDTLQTQNQTVAQLKLRVDVGRWGRRESPVFLYAFQAHR